MRMWRVSMATRRFELITYHLCRALEHRMEPEQDLCGGSIRLPCRSMHISFHADTSNPCSPKIGIQESSFFSALGRPSLCVPLQGPNV